MGTYTSLAIDDYTLLPTKSYADPTAMSVFRESDKSMRMIRFGEKSTHTILDKPVPSHFQVDEEDEGIQVLYSAPGWIIRDRLDVMGLTLDATRDVFERGITDR